MLNTFERYINIAQTLLPLSKCFPNIQECLVNVLHIIAEASSKWKVLNLEFETLKNIQ